MRKSFILHIDSLSILSKMPDEMAGKFIKLIYHFQLTGELLEMDFALEMAITPFINQFERDKNSYEKTCETNRLNGLKGGRPEKQKEPIKSEKTHSVNSETKKPYNDNDSNNDNKSKSDNKNDNKNDNAIIILTENEFSQTSKEKTFKQWTLEDFQNDIKKYHLQTNLDKNDLISFYDYWRELTPTKKMKFQNEKSWETNLRLKKWERSKTSFGQKYTPKQDQKQEMGEAFKESLIFQLNKIKQNG